MAWRVCCGGWRHAGAGGRTQCAGKRAVRTRLRGRGACTTAQAAPSPCAPDSYALKFIQGITLHDIALLPSSLDPWLLRSFRNLGVQPKASRDHPQNPNLIAWHCGTRSCRLPTWGQKRDNPSTHPSQGPFRGPVFPQFTLALDPCPLNEERPSLSTHNHTHTHADTRYSLMHGSPTARTPTSACKSPSASQPATHPLRS